MKFISHSTNYRPDIDGLRAIAVILVVVHHAFPKLLPGGFIGVDLFFVISGFLITTIIFQNLERGSFRFLDFYTRRIKRIFPALALVLITCLVYGWFTLLPADYKLLGKHTVAGAAFVSNFAFWIESGYFNGDSKLKPLLHLWSLGIEEQYYIVWPLIAWFAWKKQVNLLKVCLVLLIASLLANIVTVKYNAVAAFFSPATRFWELLVGSVLAYVGLHRPASQQSYKSQTIAFHNNQAAWAGLLLLLIGMVFIKPVRRFPGFWALLPTLAAYLIIYAGPQAWFNRKVLSNKLLVWFGLISFPLYLWHWPLLVFAQLSANQALSTQLILLVVAMSIVLAWLTYRFVERPFRFGSKTRLIPIVLCFVLVAIAAGGSYIYINNGFESRFPKFIRNLINPKINLHDGWRLHKCILDITNTAKDYADECIEKNTKPLVFLWGDSHAAALYPGFKHLQSSKKYTFGMAQRNAAICPPILNYTRQDNVGLWCNDINNSNLAIIKDVKPDIVILYAYWPYGINSMGNIEGIYELNKLGETIFQLKTIGIKNVIIIGPTPYWKNSLPDNIMLYWKTKNSMKDTPVYMSYGLDENIHLYNNTMRNIATALGVKYIDSISYLCTTDGCLTRDSVDGTNIASIDYGHLTIAAAENFINRISNEIFTNTK